MVLTPPIHWLRIATLLLLTPQRRIRLESGTAVRPRPDTTSPTIRELFVSIPADSEGQVRVHPHHQRDGSRTQLHGRDTLRIGALQRLPTLHASPTSRAVTDLDVEAPYDGGAPPGALPDTASPHRPPPPHGRSRDTLPAPSRRWVSSISAARRRQACLPYCAPARRPGHCPRPCPRSSRGKSPVGTWPAAPRRVTCCQGGRVAASAVPCAASTDLGPARPASGPRPATRSLVLVHQCQESRGSCSAERRCRDTTRLWHSRESRTSTTALDVGRAPATR